MTDNISFMQ